MDILNFISWIRGGRVVTTVDPNKTLLPVGLKDGRRDDEYLAGAISVADLAAQISPQPSYKVYTALLTQSGTDAPVATVLENTLGVNISYQYNSTGNYFIIADNPIFLSSGKVYVQFQLWADDSISPRFGLSRWLDSVTLEMIVNNVNGSSDGIGNPPNTGTGRFLTSIEIRVYN